MKKLNKFEKRFVIVDLFSTATIFGGAIILLFHSPNIINLIIISLFTLFYYFKLRKSIWRSLEEKERAEIYNLPIDWKGEINIFDSIKAKACINEDPILK